MTEDAPITVAWPLNPPDDPRTVDELMTSALCESDEDLTWQAISILQWRGSREIMDRAVALCRSTCPVERRVGAHILGQLGLPERTFPEECYRTLRMMIEAERDEESLAAIMTALSHLRREETAAIAGRFRKHGNPDIRHAVAFAMTGLANPEAVAALIELTRDPVDYVRDWATFGLGSQTDLDTPEIRAALAARLADEDLETREEAILGLARRGDRRMLPMLREELAAGLIGSNLMESAALIRAPELYPLLVAFRGQPNVRESELEEAIQACSVEGSDAGESS